MRCCSAARLGSSQCCDVDDVDDIVDFVDVVDKVFDGVVDELYRVMLLMMLWCCTAVWHCSTAWLKGRLTNVWSIAAILRDAQCCTNTLGPNTNTHGK